MWNAYYAGKTEPLLYLKIACVIVPSLLSLDLIVKGMRTAKGGAPMDPAYAKRSGKIRGQCQLLQLSLRCSCLTKT